MPCPSSLPGPVPDPERPAPRPADAERLHRATQQLHQRLASLLHQLDDWIEVLDEHGRDAGGPDDRAPIP
ncbi:hypothetical protein [Patulibacter minatonensis]|uniref:hypothetical protein n=1 Tax=Patulibacter minatonensis TaxID=298163 RepID=UPI000478726B|nr:hypothetical protein [Patulibacter minatonensis]